MKKEKLEDCIGNEHASNYVETDLDQSTNKDIATIRF